MSVHPNVLKANEVIHSAPYSSPAHQHQLLKECVEAWLRDDKWLPELLGGGNNSIGMRVQLLPDNVATLPSEMHISEWLSDFARMNNLDSVSIAMSMTSRRVGMPRPKMPSLYFLATYSKDLGNPLYNFWNIAINEAGEVLNWSPEIETANTLSAAHGLKVF